jgi:hypothetical protein
MGALHQGIDANGGGIMRGGAQKTADSNGNRSLSRTSDRIKNRQSVPGFCNECARSIAYGLAKLLDEVPDASRAGGLLIVFTGSFCVSCVVQPTPG